MTSYRQEGLSSCLISKLLSKLKCYFFGFFKICISRTFLLTHIFFAYPATHERFGLATTTSRFSHLVQKLVSTTTTAEVKNGPSNAQIRRPPGRVTSRLRCISISCRAAMLHHMR